MITDSEEAATDRTRGRGEGHTRHPPGPHLRSPSAVRSPWPRPTAPRPSPHTMLSRSAVGDIQINFRAPPRCSDRPVGVLGRTPSHSGGSGRPFQLESEKLTNLGSLVKPPDLHVAAHTSALGSRGLADCAGWLHGSRGTRGSLLCGHCIFPMADTSAMSGAVCSNLSQTSAQGAAL